MKPIRTALTALALATFLVACSAASGGQAPAQDPSSADITVTAVDMAFDPGTITVSGGGSFTVALVNEDTMPHNIAIYTDESRSQKLFEGEMVTDGTIVYEVADLEPGEYFFDCSLHPTMTGTLVVEG